MNERTSSSNTEISILTKVIDLGIDEAQLDAFDVVILPEDYIDSESSTDEVYSSESFTLAKLLRREGAHCGISKDLGLESSTLIRRGAEIWLGVLWILTEIGFDLTIAVLANWLISGHKKNKITVDYAIGRNSLIMKYSGDSESFIEILRESKGLFGECEENDTD